MHLSLSLSLSARSRTERLSSFSPSLPVSSAGRASASRSCWGSASRGRRASSGRGRPEDARDPGGFVGAPRRFATATPATSCSGVALAKSWQRECLIRLEAVGSGMSGCCSDRASVFSQAVAFVVVPSRRSSTRVGFSESTQCCDPDPNPGSRRVVFSLSRRWGLAHSPGSRRVLSRSRSVS